MISTMSNTMQYYQCKYFPFQMHHIDRNRYRKTSTSFNVCYVLWKNTTKFVSWTTCPKKQNHKKKIEKSATKWAKNWAPNLCFYNSSTKPKQAKKQQQRHENSSNRKKKIILQDKFYYHFMYLSSGPVRQLNKTF